MRKALKASSRRREGDLREISFRPKTLRGLALQGKREVDGKLLSSMNDDEMAAALNMALVHVKKFRIKLKRIQEVFSKDMEEEEIELKSFLKDNSLGLPKLVKALSSLSEEHADEVFINKAKYKVAVSGANAAGTFAPVCCQCSNPLVDEKTDARFWTRAGFHVQERRSAEREVGKVRRYSSRQESRSD
eukprot:340120-Hanusia_phi.AAC.1